MSTQPPLTYDQQMASERDSEEAFTAGALAGVVGGVIVGAIAAVIVTSFFKKKTE